MTRPLVQEFMRTVKDRSDLARVVEDAAYWMLSRRTPLRTEAGRKKKNVRLTADDEKEALYLARDVAHLITYGMPEFMESWKVHDYVLPYVARAIHKRKELISR